MTGRSALRPRQSSIAATVSHTPLKEIKRRSVGRKSLPRAVKIVAELVGYKDQLLSPTKRSPLKDANGIETPATKISQKMFSKLVIKSPDNPAKSDGRDIKTRAASRRLNLTSKPPGVGNEENALNTMKDENDENIPPVGDTIGRRVHRRTAKAISDLQAFSAPSQASTRTPIKMKIRRTNDSTEICEFSVKRTAKSTPISSRNVSVSTRSLPLKARLRSVVVHESNAIGNQTVGSESLCGQKRTPARVIPTKAKLTTKPRPTDQDSSFEFNVLEESSSDDYSNDESKESDDASYGDTSEIPKRNSSHRISSQRRTVRFKASSAFSSDTKRKGLNRNVKVATRNVETLEEFRRRLHTAEVPERMPCREEESAEVAKFIRNAVSTNGTSSAMYISGVPGTGKTATVISVVKQLSQDKNCNKFTFVCVNAMEYVEPRKIFVDIYSQITGDTRRISPAAARKKLNAMFELIDISRLPIVILVDELDQLCTKRQELIYDIFNWTSNESARVSVMAIANTLDLPERLLNQRISSRIGAARICFQPYEFQQIECIIRDRLSGSADVIDEGAVQFAARKVAAVTGDLRKAMDLLRRAIEIAIGQGSKKLLVEHVLSTTREASSTLMAHFVKGLSKHSLLLFRSAVSLAEKRDDFSFAELHAQYLSFATNLEGIEPLVESVLISLIGQLCSTRLLVQSTGDHILRRRIRLGMSYHDAQSAIRIRENDVRDGA